ncbi:unnamed protein product [Schistosoma rodhaini]|uniref:Dendritic cell-specific transmembrane protein-like domain-containing protein n=1 Tax=Schistosoma rodhaini TaxID=6188 RepID=A0AA85EXA0_9TREM|nr:unnamed protein product [Schistosoma rodhaini]
MWKLHSCILSISITLLIFIHNIIMLCNSMSHLPTNLVSREIDIELDTVHRLKSHLSPKIIFILCGSSICIFYWIIVLIVRLNFNDLDYYQQIIKNYLKYLWNLLILPYILFSLVLSIYTMLILIDDISLLKEDISNYMYRIIDAIGSTEFSVNRTNQLINHLERLQYDFTCRGVESQINWLLNKYSLSVNYMKSFHFHNHIIIELSSDLWNFIKQTEFLLINSCGHNRTNRCLMQTLYTHNDWNNNKITFIIPVYEGDCTKSITLQLASELNSVVWMYSSLNIGLHIIQLFLDINTYANVLANIPCKKWFIRIPEPRSKASIQHNIRFSPHEIRNNTHINDSHTHTHDFMSTGNEEISAKTLSHPLDFIKECNDTQILENEFKKNVESLKIRSHEQTNGLRRHLNIRTTLGPYDTKVSCYCAKKSFLFGPAGYVSNLKLLKVYQNFHLYIKSSEKELDNLLDKVYATKNTNIGWTLKDSSKQQPYVIYVPKSDFKTKKLNVYNKFRYWLKKRWPFLEALIYDDNDKEDKRVNHMHRNYLIFILRCIFFLSFGYILGKMIVLIIRNIFYTSVMAEVEYLTVENYTEDSWNNTKHIMEAYKIIQEVEERADMFIMITIVIGTLISSRVRCLSLLVIPTFGLTVGHILVANQLIHTTFIGPMTSIDHNLNTLRNVFSCLNELNHNVSRVSDSSNHADYTYYDVGNSSTDLILSYNAPSYVTTSLKILRLMNEAGRDLSEAISKYQYNLPSLDKLTDDYRNLTNIFEKSYSQFDFVSKTFQSEAKKLSHEMNRRFHDRFEEFKLNVKAYKSENVALNQIGINTLNIDMKNMQLEYEMLNYLLHKCIAIHERKFSICLNESQKICKTLTKNPELQGVWLNDLCAHYYQPDEFCELSTYMNELRHNCVLDMKVIEMEFGFSSYLSELYELLKSFKKSMKIEILTNKSEVNKEDIQWIETEEEIIDKIEFIDVTMTPKVNNLLNSFILSTTLFRLFFILLIYQAHKYISNYLLDINFDNLYFKLKYQLSITKLLIDDQMMLSPLKSIQKFLILLNYFSSIWMNIKNSSKNLFLVIMIGLILLCIFYLDSQTYDLVNLLDILLLNHIQFNDNITEKFQKVIISNYTTNMIDTTIETNFVKDIENGLFEEITKVILQNIEQSNDNHLNYNINECRRYGLKTDLKYNNYFYSLWMIFMVLTVTSTGLLYMRHRIVEFFYPEHIKRRKVALSSYLLVLSRNYLSESYQQTSDHGQSDCLQEEMRNLPELSILGRIYSKLIYLFSFDKSICSICYGKFQPYPKDNVTIG